MRWYGRLAALIATLLSVSLYTLPSAVAAPSSQTQGISGSADLQRQQTRYYKAQADELERQRGDFYASHAAMLSVAGPIAALLAVIASLLALLQNAASGRRAQRDAMFGDALKRFGDIASAPARASAAIALGQLAVRYPQWGSNRRIQRRVAGAEEAPRLRASDYYDPCLAQLSVGLQMERDENVVGAIGKALGLVSSAPSHAFADEIDVIRLVTLQELVRVTVAFVSEVVVWYNAHLEHPETASQYERDVYMPLINQAMNFEQHRASAISFWSGMEITEVQRIAFERDFVDWRQAQFAVGPTRPRTLSHADVARLRKTLRLLLRKLRICYVLSRANDRRPPLMVRV